MAEPQTMAGYIAKWAEEKPNAKALVEMAPDGAWHSTTWAEYWQAVRDTAKGLIQLGLQTLRNGVPVTVQLNDADSRRQS
jgi:long-subunit acyl-CoA synthetase (AMP-forming)